MQGLERETTWRQIPEMRRVRRVHFVGIGGSGMCGIAEVLLHQNYEISGTDISEGAEVRRLRSLGVDVHIGHDPAQVEGADVVVVSNAVDEANVELHRAQELRIPIVPRAEMLAELMRFRHGIAVAGTHGKTTTTSMVSAVLAQAGGDPTFVIGGRLSGIDTNARLGSGRYLVAEADESDASFLHLQPMVTILTNLEADHLENYGGDFNSLCNAYVEFLHNLPFYGLAVLCIDDPTVRAMVPRVGRPLRSYGFSADADFRVCNFRQEGLQAHFDVCRPEAATPLSLQLTVPGRHNACNAAATVAVAAEEGVNDEQLCRALQNFTGVGRRFQVDGPFAWDDADLMLVDDYGHHPTELRITIDMVREIWPGRRLLMAFQPHRYSRLRNLYEDFVDVLSGVDTLLILETYAAGEVPIPEADSRSLCRSLRRRGRIEPIFVPELQETADTLLPLCQGGDVLLVQGAGSIHLVAEELRRRLPMQQSAPVHLEPGA